MKKEVRTVVYDDELNIEAYRFEGVVQPFPNHFHENYYVTFHRKPQILYLSGVAAFSCY